MNTKKCKYCLEDIHIKANRCKYCKNEQRDLYMRGALIMCTLAVFLIIVILIIMLNYQTVIDLIK